MQEIEKIKLELETYKDGMIGVYDADKEAPDYDRMITWWSRISSDEQIAVFNLFGTDKPHGATKQYKSIIKECLAMKQQLDGTWL